MYKNNAITGVDYAKLFFAISIISLHIPYKSEMLNLYSQTIGRLGVPFFFTVAGYFLYSGILKNDTGYLRKYCLRIGKLFVIWLLIYLPVFLYTYSNHTGLHTLLLEIIFSTPGFLWYLSTLCVAAFLFGIFYRKSPSIYLTVSILLYLVGCSGNTYIHILKLEEFWQPYLSIFISTRNALFFAPLFLGIGALLKDSDRIRLQLKHAILLTILFGVIYVSEVLTVLNLDPGNKDYSFYVSLPFIVFFLLYLLFHTNCKSRNTLGIRQFSTFLYCSQYGFMVVLDIVSSRLSVLRNGLLLWVLIIAMAGAAFLILNTNKPGRKISSWLV